MLGSETFHSSDESKAGPTIAEHLLWNSSLSDKLQNGYDAWSFHHWLSVGFAADLLEDFQNEIWLFKHVQVSVSHRKVISSGS